MKTFDYLIVGAGFFGSVLAERLANVLDKTVLVVERRSHIGGNCYSEKDRETGIEYHKYGTHIFHTDNQEVWQYLTKFTNFNNYRHQVLTTYKDKVYQMPFNLETINSFYNLNLRPFEAREFIKKEVAKELYPSPNNLEEKAISLIGRPLYEAFIKDYTTKQWGKSPTELPAEIITRLPIRFNYQEDYFVNCKWQGIPENGYTAIFERLLSSKNIQLELNCDYLDNNREAFSVREKVIFTGPIDQYFDYCFGRLEWRGLEFKKKYISVRDYQGTSVMNFAELSPPFTRVHEPSHLHPERQYKTDKTIIFEEYPNNGGLDQSYPINTARNKELLAIYRKLADQHLEVIFGGRLGEYAYYDMDATILSALQLFTQIAKKQSPTDL